MKQRLQWLKVIKKRYLGLCEILPLAGFWASIAIGWILKIAGILSSVWYAGIWGILWLFGILPITHWMFYNMSYCPKCGYKPTKFKNGKNKPINRVYKEFSDLSACPNCGYPQD